MEKKTRFISLLFLLFFLVGTTIISASNYTTHIHKGGYSKSNAQNLSVNIRPSVDHYGGSYRSRIVASLNSMTGVSSKLGWHQTTSGSPKINIAAGNWTTVTWYGEAAYYCGTTVITACSKDSSTARARTEIKLNGYTMTQANFSYANGHHTIIHEIGHALSLGHVSSGASVMRSGKLSYTVPQAMDKDHLKYKWGN